MEKLLNKRSLLLQKKEECEKKIREIGSLPTSEVETFKDRTLKQLMKTLHSTNQKLKGFSTVNKKALDQYVQFTEQRDKLVSRKEEMDTGRKVRYDIFLLFFHHPCIHLSIKQWANPPVFIFRFLSPL